MFNGIRGSNSKKSEKEIRGRPLSKEFPEKSFWEA